MISIVHNYINLTNGVEAIPTLQGDYRFIRRNSILIKQSHNIFLRFATNNFVH